jgi:hypothetical protein
VAACETNILTTPGNKTTEDEFAGEEYPEDWEWPELMALTLLKDGAPVPAEGLELETGEANSVTLTAQLNGQAVPATDIYWVSSKPGSVSVENGVVTALASGEVYVKAQVIASGEEGICKVKGEQSLSELEEEEAATEDIYLYEEGDADPKNLSEVSGDNPLAKALAWIKNNGTDASTYTIILNSDIEISSEGFTIGTNGVTTGTSTTGTKKNLIIKLKGLKETRTITKTGTGTLFTISGDSTGDAPHLILDSNIKLQGNNSNANYLVIVGGYKTVKPAKNLSGTLTVRAGCTIIGNSDSGGNTNIQKKGTLFAITVEEGGVIEGYTG